MNEPQTEMIQTPSCWIAWLSGIILPSTGFAAAFIIEEIFGAGADARRIVRWILTSCFILSPCVCFCAVLSDPRTSVWMKVLGVLISPIAIALVSFTAVVVMGIIGIMHSGLAGTQ